MIFVFVFEITLLQTLAHSEEDSPWSCSLEPLPCHLLLLCLVTKGMKCHAVTNESSRCKEPVSRSVELDDWLMDKVDNLLSVVHELLSSSFVI